MKKFYKINPLQMGEGYVVPYGATEYEEDNKPEELVIALENEIKKQEVANKVQEYKAYLLSTDYKMTVDYFATLSIEAQDEFTVKRAEAREYIRANDETDME